MDLDLGAVDSGLAEARHVGRTLEASYAYGEDEAIEARDFETYLSLNDAVIAVFPVLHHLETDMLKDIMRHGKDSAVSRQAYVRVSKLRGLSLRVSMALHRGIVSAMESAQAEAA